MFRLVAAAIAALWLAATPALADTNAETPEGKVRDIFYSSIELWDDYLDFADDLEETLWEDSRFSEVETWQIWLHNSLGSQSKPFEALAQHKLLSLGQTEDEIRALYTLDPRVYDPEDLVLFRVAQRAGSLPVRTNSTDIADLRVHYDEREIVDVLLLSGYGAMISMLYGTGHVDDPVLNPGFALTKLHPDLTALKQEKQQTSMGFEKRQYLESPILSPNLSMPYLGMDWLMFNEHAFSVGEAWEFFMIGMKASDCKHCQTHAALGMQYYSRQHSRIQALYLYGEDPTPFTPKERAAFDFMRAAVQLPSQMTPEIRAAVEANYTDFEIDHLIGMAGVIVFLSNYMQTTAVVTDQESVNFANQVLTPVGWHLGRHAGWPEEQRVMHPTTLFRLTEGEGAVEKNLVFYSHAFWPVLIGYWTDRLGLKFVILIFEIVMLVLLLLLIPRSFYVLRGANG
ncbi:MAG: hypothetical protein AAF494_13765 [Pseudomonadota bacterium]